MDSLNLYSNLNENFDASNDLCTVVSEQNLEKTENESISIFGSHSFPEYTATAGVFSELVNTTVTEGQLTLDHIEIEPQNVVRGAHQVMSRSKSLNINIENSIYSHNLKPTPENIHNSNIMEPISDSTSIYLQSLYELIIRNGTKLTKHYEYFANAPSSESRSKYPVDTFVMLLKSVLDTTNIIINVAGSVMSLNDLRKVSRTLRRMIPEIIMEAESIRIDPEANKMSTGKKLVVLLNQLYNEVNLILLAYQSDYTKLCILNVSNFRIDTVVEQHHVLDDIPVLIDVLKSTGNEIKDPAKLSLYYHTYQLEHIDNTKQEYRIHFLGREHRTYIAKHESKGPIIISIIHEGLDEPHGGHYRTIIRQKEVFNP
ncbi:hypothetical protein HK096_008195 [Nowakowskiella sp. JEL0078]|nr:hypothetical protein HK096_008195 [Nowakowskiella sp. JEL0078]